MPVVQLNYTNTLITDTYVAELDPTINYSTSEEFRSGKGSSAASLYYSLLKYDMGLIPNGAIINSATLTIAQRGIPTSATTFDIRAITEPWQKSVTWDTRPNFESESSGSFSSTSSFTLISTDITSLVQRWVDGSLQNNGMLISVRNQTMINTMTAFGSSRHTNLSARPKIDVTYTIPTTGKKQVEYVGSSNQAGANSTQSLQINTPALAQNGDLLVAVVAAKGASAINSPSGWTRNWVSTSSGTRHLIATKFMDTVDRPIFSTPETASIIGTVHVFRNVKAISATTRNVPSSTANFSPPAISTSVLNNLNTLINTVDDSVPNCTPPLSYDEKYEQQSVFGTMQMSMRYLYEKNRQESAEMVTVLSAARTGVSVALMLEPMTNNPPTLTLTSPTDNQTLSEGSNYLIEGSADDPDVGNVVTVKYQINNGPVKALESGVSSGSTPISFAKTLTYSNKRMRDGATDVTGEDLAENVDHTLTVWVEDDQGGKSAEVIRKFRVIHNRPPVIDGQNENLGPIMTPPSKTYKVTEPEGNPFTVTEKINGTVIRTFAGVPGQEETITIPHVMWLGLEPGVQHALTIEATDGQNMKSTRTYTLTRLVDKIIWRLDYDTMYPEAIAFFTTDVAAQRLLLTPIWELPPGANVLVEVCNNAYDAEPTWEDATIVVKLGRAHLFTNTTKTAAKWGINFRFTIDKGMATQPIYFKGVGGAFD